MREKPCQQRRFERGENETVWANLMRVKNFLNAEQLRWLGLLALLVLATIAGAQQATTHTMDAYIDCNPGATGAPLSESPEGFGTVITMGCGEKIAILEEAPRGHENWDKIETNSGKVGYVRRSFVSWSPPTAQEEALKAQEAQEDRKAQAAQAIHDAAEQIRSRSIDYAIQATSEIRNVMLDPTSLTVLQVIAITHREKNGSTSFRGCVRYVGSNIVGGRLQQWGVYWVSNKGAVTSYPESLWGCYGKGEQTDVTVEVKKAISQGDGQ